MKKNDVNEVRLSTWKLAMPKNVNFNFYIFELISPRFNIENERDFGWELIRR